ncbi:MAG: hypothetical protein M0R40_08160 [Firmicutes bacterium]|nr:hypothetical protein [Bacillota bacterium]
MVSKSAKKVVIISGIKSENIEQAIFILKGSKEIPFQQSIISEAEEIIRSYARHQAMGHGKSVATKRKWFRRKK